MKEVRCKHCGRLLGKLKGNAEIKCPRCKQLNNINTESAKETKIERQ